MYYLAAQSEVPEHEVRALRDQIEYELQRYLKEARRRTKFL